MELRKEPETLTSLLALPPLPKSIKNAISPVLSTSHLSLLAASQVSSSSFAIANRATQFGFSVARAFVSPILTGVGTIADHALGSNGPGIGDGVVSKGLNGAFDAVEFISLLGIKGGREITQATLGSLTSTVASLESTYGNDEAIRALAAFLKLVDFEMSDLRQYTSFSTTRAMVVWTMLQSVTSEYYGRKIAAELEEIDLHEWKSGGNSRATDTAGAVVWEITEEQVAEGGEEVIEASVSGEAEERSAQTEEEATRDCLRRYSKLCLGSYGGMGMIFFGQLLFVVLLLISATDKLSPSGVKLPSFDSTTSRTPLKSTSLTPDALTKLERQLDEESLANAFRNEPTEESAQSDAAVEAELGSLEMGRPDAESEMMTPLIETVVEEKPGFWSLLTGKQCVTPSYSASAPLIHRRSCSDLNLLETLGGMTSGSARIGKHNDDESDDDEDEEVDARRVKVREQRAKGRHPPRFFVIVRRAFPLEVRF